jgi:hypothetical protein
MTETTAKAPPKVGDYFYRSWGYDQTNADFYKVIGVTPSGKSVRLVQVRTELAEDGSGLIPTEEPYALYGDERPELRRLKLTTWSSELRWVISWNSYSNAYEWDGKPKFDTKRLGYEGH